MKYLISVEDDEDNKDKDKFILEYLRRELNKTKSGIDNHVDNWDIVKKQIHDYEYIYYSSYRKKNVSSVSPVSRSYFKFREIYFEYKIQIDHSHTVCMLAEAPGGFIQSIIHLSPNNSYPLIYANSLISMNNNIPIWNNTIKKHRLNFIYGKNNDGDLCSFSNLLSMISKIGKSTCALVTGDGGFDYSSDYSKQEYNSLRLIYSEIFMALNIQSKGGTFICKIFDSFMDETIDLLYLLNLSYGEVYLHKPKMSRNSNSEKYIVCLNFKGYNKIFINKLCHSFESLKLNLRVGGLFYNNLIKYIIEYTIQQIKSINKGISIIESSSQEYHPSSTQLKMAIVWCNKYNIKINEKCIYI